MEIRDLGTQDIVISAERLRTIVISVVAGAGDFHDQQLIDIVDSVVRRALPPTYKMPLTGATSYGRVGPEIKCEHADTCMMETHCHNYAHCREAEGRSE